MINKYPYSDMHELNADWLLSKTAELEQRVKALEEGGGENITIEPVLTSGTKIADYEIGDTPGELYAPTPITDIIPTYNNGVELAEYQVYGGVTGKIYAPTDILPELANAGYHNSVYRGKFLGNSITNEQYVKIADGSFEDMFIGDYWTIPTTINGVTSNVDYMIAAFDYWWNIGDSFPQGDNKHHIVLVPRNNLYNTKMNSTNITTGGYAGSEMYTTNLADARTAIGNLFSGHLYSVRRYFSNSVTAGQADNWDWYTSSVDLMSEIMVYGCKVWGNSGYEVGCDTAILPLFALNPKCKNTRTGWWLRTVANSSNFSINSTYGYANNASASYDQGVRPCFAIY